MGFLKNLFGGGARSEDAPAPGSQPARPGAGDDDQARLSEWVRVLRSGGGIRPGAPLGPLVARAGELTLDSPYAFKRLDAYLTAGGDREAEPLTLSLTRFEAVTLVESCVALARCAREGVDSWEAFGREVERLRYRGGKRNGYVSRLHYFSEWIADNETRGNVRDMGRELGGVEDRRPLRYITSHRSSYPALASDAVFEAIRQIEERLDATPRWVVRPEMVSQAAAGIEPGDILGFTTGVKGLDVSHVGIAYRDSQGTLRVLQALFSSSKVEITSEALPEYVVGRKSTGILVARPL
ncbi:MAG: DUF1460 domain-containing protein [Gemmatimonadetes bacterium]|nr:DUF1460 domain-containing protein [Gemmatimonadota bacterium]